MSKSVKPFFVLGCKVKSLFILGCKICRLGAPRGDLSDPPIARDRWLRGDGGFRLRTEPYTWRWLFVDGSPTAAECRFIQGGLCCHGNRRGSMWARWFIMVTENHSLCAGRCSGTIVGNEIAAHSRRHEG